MHRGTRLQCAAVPPHSLPDRYITGTRPRALSRVEERMGEGEPADATWGILSGFFSGRIVEVLAPAEWGVSHATDSGRRGGKESRPRCCFSPPVIAASHAGLDKKHVL